MARRLNRRTAPIPDANVSTSSSGSLIGSQIYRSWDGPYYKNGNKVCIAILALAIATFVAQRQWIIHLNKKKKREWGALTSEQQVEYQTDNIAREKDGNKRLDFLFQY